MTQASIVPLTTINLEGKLLAPWIEEVKTAVSTAQANGNVCLNLAELTYADHTGIELLRALQREGIALHGCSPFISTLLTSGAQTI